MSSRFWTNLVFLASLAVLSAVVFFFAREYLRVRARDNLVAEIKVIADTDGPCQALEHIKSIGPNLEVDVRRLVEMRRQNFAAQIVGDEDRAGQAAMLNGFDEGLIDLTLCEQIKLVRESGDLHPILELLRYTREGADPCEDPKGLSQAMKALTSHRRVVLRSLMSQVSQLDCMPPWFLARLAGQVAAELGENPSGFDDLDVLRIARFLETWSPIAAAQLGCRFEAYKQVSLLGSAVGCTPFHRRQVLPRYRLNLDKSKAAPGQAALGVTEVLLLAQEGDRCTVRSDDELGKVTLLACSDLVFASSVEVATLIEMVSFGLVRASLVAGLATFDGASSRVTTASREPDLKTWYAYDRFGEPLGMAQNVRLGDLASKFGEDVPDNPLRSFCERSGARYCYDVDWAQVVDVLPGDPVVFLSRPMNVFLPEEDLSFDVADKLFDEAFGRPIVQDSLRRAFKLGASGGFLLVESSRSGFELSWRLTKSQSWAKEAFGTYADAKLPPTARLLVVMDLEQDGRPELLVQVISRKETDFGLKDSQDELVLFSIEAAGKRLKPINRLTVHEY